MRLLITFILVLMCFAAQAQIGMQLGRTVVSAPPVTYNTEPDDISNLIAWWESDALVTESSGSVSAWEDQVGGYVVDESGLEEPTYSSSVSVLNNQPGINFDGNNDNLSLLGTTIPKGSDFTVIVVCHPETSTTQMRPVGWEFSSAENSMIAPVRMYDTNMEVAFAYTTGVVWESNSPSGSFSDNTTHMFTAVYEEGVEMTSWRDKTKGTPQSITGTWRDGGQSDRFRIGSNRSGSGQYFDGYIICVLIYNKLLSDTEIQNLYDDYFKVKYGI